MSLKKFKSPSLCVLASKSIQNTSMNLVLSTDPKPRLKWTPELHQRFSEAVKQLGGADKATPKSLMRVMGIPGLTLYHLKSHLQKYRLGKSQHGGTCIDNDQEVQSPADYGEFLGSDDHGNFSDRKQDETKESLQIAQALQMQFEVQKKLHEQIEVQRHLQLRIEAHGKYLQSVLIKAQETLAGYTSSSVGIELARAELSRLVSMANTGPPSSSFSELTEAEEGLGLKDTETKGFSGTKTICSLEGSLTSAESSGIKEDMESNNENDDNMKNSVELSLMGINQTGKKRSFSQTSGAVCAEQSVSKKMSGTHEGKRIGGGEHLSLDLNSQYFQKDVDEAGSNAV